MEGFQNTLFTNDNLFILYGLNSEIADLIYLDPPFNSKRMYSAPVGSRSAGSSFKDMWEWKDVNEAYLETLAEKYPALAKFITTIASLHSKDMMAYITYMAQRMIELHRILKDTGSIYLHCDPTASHYLKLLLDEIFGKKNFRNEIVWEYSTGGISKKHYARKHDIILFYTKSEKYHFDLPKQESRDINRFNLIDEKGKHYYEKAGNRYYLDDGVAVRDIWDIYPVRHQSAEATGYPTQKPLALLKRIITSSSKEGDVVLDPFCGCATTCISAQLLNRKWIGIDISEKSANILLDRLTEAGAFLPNDRFVHRTDIPKRTDVKEESDKNPNVKKQLFKEQDGKCNGCNIDFPEKILEVDHIVPKAKGGGDYYENYQLLCSSCNRIKGARPMEYLRLKIKAIEEKLKLQFTFGE